MEGNTFSINPIIYPAHMQKYVITFNLQSITLINKPIPLTGNFRSISGVPPTFKMGKAYPDGEFPANRISGTGWGKCWKSDINAGGNDLLRLVSYDNSMST